MEYPPDTPLEPRIDALVAGTLGTEEITALLVQLRHLPGGIAYLADKLRDFPRNELSSDSLT